VNLVPRLNHNFVKNQTRILFGSNLLNLFSFHVPVHEWPRFFHLWRPAFTPVAAVAAVAAVAVHDRLDNVHLGAFVVGARGDGHERVDQLQHFIAAVFAVACGGGGGEGLSEKAKFLLHYFSKRN
jgi:hypothetical protein